MSKANRALQDEFNDEDPFLDADDVERMMLGEASYDDVVAEPRDEDGFAQADLSAADDRPFGASAQFESSVEDDPFLDAEALEPAPVAPASNPLFDGLEDELSDMLPASSEPLYGEVDDDIPSQPVPRITIAAFCERAETGALIQHAAEDRRLAKAHVNVAMGGLPAAIETFHDETTPNLLIVESGMRGRGLFDQLEELAGVCDPDTKVVIIGATNDIVLYRELIKRGVSEYLVPPMSPLHLIRTVSELFLDPEQPFAGRSIAFIGSKGGVGSSTIAHNCAWALTENQSQDAVLMDMDLSWGTAGLDFNQDPAQTLGDALSEPDRLDDALLDRLLVRCTERLSLFSAPATLDRDWEFSPHDYELVIDKVRRQAPVVALDLPHLWMPWVKQTLLSADDVVVTVTPDLASLRNAKNLFDLVTGARPNDDPPKVVVNMSGMPKRPEIPVKDFAEALGQPPVLVLPFEPQLFGKAANNGQMISELDPKSKAADGFSHLARIVTGRAAAAPQKKSLVAKLFGG